MQTLASPNVRRPRRAVVPASLLAIVLGLALAPPEGDELRAVHREGQTLAVTLDDWMSIEVDEVSMRINDREMEGEMLEELAKGLPSGRQKDHLVTTTWIDAVADGLPVQVRRRFDESSRVEEEGGDEQETDGVLVGRTLLLTAGDDGAVEAEVAEEDDGGAIDDVYLAGHLLTIDEGLYLPERPVSVGDTWTLDEDEVLALLKSDGPILFEADAEGGDEFEEMMTKAGRFTGTVEYAAREDVDGVACAVLVLSMMLEASDVEMDPAAMGMQPEEGMETAATMGMHVTGEERIWFAIEEGRPVRSRVEMEGEVTMRLVMTRADVGLEIAIDAAFEFAGGQELDVSAE